MGLVSEPQNPNGVATWGVVILAHDNYPVYNGCGVVGVGKGMTNSVAEYEALVKCLKKLLADHLNEEEVIIYSDSEMLVGQMLGHMKANKGEYLLHFFKAKELAQSFTHIKYQWVSRNFNKEADSLTRQAYEEYCKKHGLKTKYAKYKRKSKVSRLWRRTHK